MSISLFVYGELLDSNIVKRLGIDNSTRIDYVLVDYTEVYLYSGKSTLIKKKGSRVSGHIISIEPEVLWRVDQWKELPIVDRVCLKVPIGNGIVDVYTHITNDMAFCVEKKPHTDIVHSVEKFCRDIEQNRIPYGDLHLLIPCAINTAQFYERTRSKGCVSEFATMLLEKVKFANNLEFRSDFVKTLQRIPVGKYYFTYLLGGENEYKLDGAPSEQVKSQACIVTCSIHEETQLVVLDIAMPAVTISAHEIITYFCYQNFSLANREQSVSISKWLEDIGLSVYGIPRSVIFSSKTLERRDLINALASEGIPMGNIMGKAFVEASTNNIAQYDTAEVYVSENTFCEIFKDFRIDLNERMDYQSIELFFLELLLLQDAAVSRVCEHIQTEIDYEKINFRTVRSSESLDELIAETSQAVRFWDIDQFYFPTVRISAKNIAELFGTPRLMEKYNQGITMLEKLISIHETKIDTAESKVLNALILLLTIIQVFPSFVDIIKNLLNHSITPNDITAFLISCGVSAFILALYSIVRKSAIRKKLSNRRKKRRLGN